jgi:hypothetical protein
MLVQPRSAAQWAVFDVKTAVLGDLQRNVAEWAVHACDQRNSVAINPAIRNRILD